MDFPGKILLYRKTKLSTIRENVRVDGIMAKIRASPAFATIAAAKKNPGCTAIPGWLVNGLRRASMVFQQRRRKKARN
jgi:hypothetical protein